MKQNSANLILLPYKLHSLVIVNHHRVST